MDTSRETFELAFALEYASFLPGEGFFGEGDSFFGDDEKRRSYSDRRLLFAFHGEPVLLLADVPVFAFRSRFFAASLLSTRLMVCVYGSGCKSCGGSAATP